MSKKKSKKSNKPTKAKSRKQNQTSLSSSENYEQNFIQNKNRYPETYSKSVNDYALREMIQNGKRSIIEMESDGNCLFRSISHHLHQDYGANHYKIRDEICNYLEQNEKDFGVYLLMDEDEEDVREFESYVKEMREDGTWGGHVEIVCAARLYHRNILVFSASGCYSVEFHNGDTSESPSKPSGPDILLSYHENSHYNCIHDEIKHKHDPKMMDSASDTTRDSTTTSATSSSSISSRSDASKTEDVKSFAFRKNEPCPCGSAIKYKKCCLDKEKRKSRLEKHIERKKNSSDPSKNDPKIILNPETQSLECEFQMMRI